jgi:decaprenyl-phosphate phosphoribosyltransferase
VSTVLGSAFLITVGAYLAVAATYSMALKRVAVLDIAAVAAGFVIRAIGGSAATGVPVSQWFLILVSFGALFVVAGKRYTEYAAMGDRIDEVRTPMREYSAAYLRYVWMVASAVAIAAYCLWAFSQPHARHGIPWSELSAIPFVLAVLRYALVLEGGGGGAPEDVFVRDRPLLALVAVWLAVYGCGVYLGR